LVTQRQQHPNDSNTPPSATPTKHYRQAKYENKDGERKKYASQQMAVLHQQCPTRSVEPQERKPHPLINILQHYITSSFLEKSRSKQRGKPQIAGENDKKRPPNTTFAALIYFYFF
jgi:hypothetical protein